MCRLAAQALSSAPGMPGGLAERKAGLAGRPAPIGPAVSSAATRPSVWKAPAALQQRSGAAPICRSSCSSRARRAMACLRSRKPTSWPRRAPRRGGARGHAGLGLGACMRRARRLARCPAVPETDGGPAALLRQPGAWQGAAAAAAWPPTGARASAASSACHSTARAHLLPCRAWMRCSRRSATSSALARVSGRESHLEHHRCGGTCRPALAGGAAWSVPAALACRRAGTPPCLTAAVHTLLPPTRCAGVKLAAFKPFTSAANALEQINAVSESQVRCRRLLRGLRSRLGGR